MFMQVTKWFYPTSYRIPWYTMNSSVFVFPKYSRHHLSMYHGSILLPKPESKLRLHHEVVLRRAQHVISPEAIAGWQPALSVSMIAYGLLIIVIYYNNYYCCYCCCCYCYYTMIIINIMIIIMYRLV
jgi:hypothetical protein